MKYTEYTDEQIQEIKRQRDRRKRGIAVCDHRRQAGRELQL